MSTAQRRLSAETETTVTQENVSKELIVQRNTEKENGYLTIRVSLLETQANALMRCTEGSMADPTRKSTGAVGGNFTVCGHQVLLC